MEKIVTVRVLLCSILIALILPSCAKTGPAGATGATGSQGPAGPQGPKGDTGTANVIYSQWTGGFSGNSANWYIPAITQAVFDSGAVLVYGKGQGVIFPLPYTSNGGAFSFNDLIYVGYIMLYCDNNNNLSAYSYRYIIIPGGVAVQDVRRGYRYIAGKFNITP